jgi:hypothetical protein
MLALTGRHAQSASSLQNLDSSSLEYGVASGSRPTSDHLLGGATYQTDGGLSPSSTCDSFVLGPEWDLSIDQDDDLSWVRDDAARQAYYEKIYQEEFDKLMLEWQQEKEARILCSSALSSISSSPIYEAPLTKKLPKEPPVQPMRLSLLPPELPLELPELSVVPLELPLEPSELPFEPPGLSLELLEPPLEPSELPLASELPLEPSELPLESSELPLKSSDLPVELSGLLLKLSEVPLEPSEIVSELSELPHLSSLSPSQRSWSLLVRRVRPPPAPPWSLQLMAVRDVQQGPAGGLSSAIWRGHL